MMRLKQMINYNYTGNLLLSVLLSVFGTILNYSYNLMTVLAPSIEDRMSIIFYLQCLSYLSAFGVFVVTVIKYVNYRKREKNISGPGARAKRKR